MNLEFFYLIGMVMLFRLPYLSRDLILSKRHFITMSALQIMACLPLNISWSWLILPTAIVFINLLLFYYEHKRNRVIYGLRLLTLLLFVFCFSVVFSNKLNPGLNDTLFNNLTALNQYVLFLDTSANIGWHTINAIFAGLLFVTIEVNFFIRYIFSAFNLEPKQKQLQPSNQDVSIIDTKEYNAGRFIGILERLLIFFFVLQSQYGAIAFILAAKGFTRFKELDEREFAEYVLIGTLLSAVLAVLVALIIHSVLN
ncbi:hypothetical protein [Kaarinaea lacus]